MLITRPFSNTATFTSLHDNDCRVGKNFKVVTIPFYTTILKDRNVNR